MRKVGGTRAYAVCNGLILVEDRLQKNLNHSWTQCYDFEIEFNTPIITMIWLNMNWCTSRLLHCSNILLYRLLDAESSVTSCRGYDSLK